MNLVLPNGTCFGTIVIAILNERREWVGTKKNLMGVGIKRAKESRYRMGSGR